MDSNLLKISDGHLYRSTDMARLLCHDCAGCSDCCRDMDTSIVLDPYDVSLLCQGLGCTFADLVQRGVVDFHIENGLMLPHLAMKQISANLAEPPQCTFLNNEGRCSIHQYRPGICRLYPLGRNYDEQGLRYFVLKDGCKIDSRQKVKIEKWLGIKNLKAYEEFETNWHDLKKSLEEHLMQSQDATYSKAVNAGFIKLFYEKPYTADGFFTEIKERIAQL